jgi:hypothetical protein
MPLPPRRKRCSFGGKEGVWWRRKKLSLEPAVSLAEAGVSKDDGTTDIIEGTPAAESQPERVPVLEDSATVVEWDEALARPIYRRNSVCDNQVVSSSSEESGDDDENSAPDVPHEERPVLKRARSSAPSSGSSRLGVRRTKTFGGRSRRPLSLLLSQDNLGNLSPGVSSATKPEDAPVVPAAPLLEVNDSSLDPQEGGFEAAAAASATLSDEHHGTPQVPLDISEDLDTGDEEDSAQLLSSATSSPASEPNAFEFGGDDEGVSAPHRRTATPSRPTATSSIEQAKRYFEHLDTSCHLQLDSSASPSPRRPIIRTTRKIQLSSPGFVQEYSKYASTSRDMGISPLKTVDYAKSRRGFFRKAELFDGFVDS